MNKEDIQILVVDDEPGMRDLLSFEIKDSDKIPGTK